MILEDRVSKLEREVRWWRRGGVVCLVAAALALGMGMQQAVVPAVLKARSVQIVDAQGRKRIDLGLVAGQASMRMYTPNGRERMTADLSLGQPRVVVRDTQGVARGVLGMVNGRPAVDLNDADGDRRMSIEVNGGSGNLEAFDATGAMRTQIGGVDAATWSLFDPAERLRLVTKIDAHPGGAEWFAVSRMFTEAGVPTIEMNQDGPGNFALYDGEGVTRTRLTQGPFDGGALYLGGGVVGSCIIQRYQDPRVPTSRAYRMSATATNSTNTFSVPPQ